jgi:C4-dicarboxylate-specific signal transduction histidine kinase
LPTVFVCDDSSTVRTVIASLLSGRYECHLFERAEDVLESAKANCPDLILSDLLMDGLDGYELCRQVRSLPKLRDVPVVLLTTRADEESRAIGLEIGADDYLFKPIRPRELLARVASLVRLRQSSVQLAARGRQLERANAELRTAHVALVQAEKLASIGTLVAGVSHEINNPLAFMKSGLSSLSGLLDELVATAKPQPEVGAPLVAEMRDILREVQDGVVRLQRISVDLRASAVGGESEFEEIALAEEIGRQWKLACMRRLAKPELVLNVPPALTVRTVRHKLGQVLLNLLVNAIQAMKGDGTVTVDAALDAGEVRLAVRDSGPGIPPDHLSRIFDPFFTTKAPGEGTGLGLSVSLGLMRSLGGGLSARSEPGEGATFELTLPAFAQPVVSGAPTW